MWLRTALLLILALVAWRFLSGLARSLSAPSRRAEPTPKPSGADPAAPRPDAARNWPPGDVVDVPFRDAGSDRAASR